MTELKYEIVKSGSSGNCVIVNDVMIDCGVPFKMIKEKLYDIAYLIITHIHSDHVNSRTLDAIKREFPRITIIGNHEVYQAFKTDVISNEGFDVLTKDYCFTPFLCPHNVLVHGYVWEWENQRIIYATDTMTLEHAPTDEKFDWFFIESNHDVKKLEEIKNREYTGYSPFLSSQRHLSTFDSKTFYYVNRRDKTSQWIELHKSERFY